MMDVELNEALKYVRGITEDRPKIALVLGSGLGDFAVTINVRKSVDCSVIPHYPIGSVAGHAGRLIFGTLEDSGVTSLPLLLFQGRVHLYENGDIEKVVFPVRLAHKLGAKILIVTNAAGGVNSRFEAGQLMLISDYLNLARKYPSVSERTAVALRKNSGLDTKLQQLFRLSARELRIDLHEGTYCWLHGPSYETAAEIKMLQTLGVDAVGMSTVPEIMEARALRMKVTGISLISNMATGLSSGKLSHEEVTETAKKIQQQFTALLRSVIVRIR